MKISLYILVLLMSLLILLFIYFEYTKLPFSELYREDKCLDNGGKISEDRKKCIGGKYDGYELQ